MKHVHDNEITSYEVDFKGRKIILRTISEEGENVEIIFKDVLTHFFEDSGHQNIIFDIATRTIEDFISENSKLIEEKQCMCWPMYFNDLNDLKEKLEEKEYKYFVIEASNGMTGFVLAKEIEKYSH